MTPSTAREEIERAVWHAMSSAMMLNTSLADYRAKPDSVERNYNLLYLSNAVDTILALPSPVGEGEVDRSGAIRRAAWDVLQMCLAHGDFRNGVEHSGLDEGDVLAGNLLDALRHAFTEYDTPLRPSPDTRSEALSPPVSGAGDGWKLPCDVEINHIRFRKGVDLATLVDAARRWHSMIMKAQPAVDAAAFPEFSEHLAASHVPAGDGGEG